MAANAQWLALQSISLDFRNTRTRRVLNDRRWVTIDKNLRHRRFPQLTLLKRWSMQKSSLKHQHAFEPPAADIGSANYCWRRPSSVVRMLWAPLRHKQRFTHPTVVIPLP